MTDAVKTIAIPLAYTPHTVDGAATPKTVLCQLIQGMGHTLAQMRVNVPILKTVHDADDNSTVEIPLDMAKQILEHMNARPFQQAMPAIIHLADTLATAIEAAEADAH